MRAIELVLRCHAGTEAQRLGYFDRVDEPLCQPPAIDPALAGWRCLLAPELRVRQTAEGLGLSGEVVDALRDCDLGAWQGLSLKALQRDAGAALQHWLDDPLAAPHGGESLHQLQLRVGHWLEHGLGPGRWLAITHPHVMRAAARHVLDLSFPASQRLDIRPLGALHLSWYGRWRVRVVG
ncbi:histidine phosphatase family protein [Pseudomonas cremoricolorata]|uniref:histidine phosphatase family protein n=1 Tax=Pseudomonas cremoricolorata TaxID=157783 RepID=UPI000402D5B0|nr:histidine phosphatase family protein [Pseudomonas cremoricolorata]